MQPSKLSAMKRLDELNARNDVSIYDIKSSRFASYGRIISFLDPADIISYMEQNTPVPENGNIYVPSVAALEEFPIIKEISATCFGGMDIQAGYCNGRNNTYNGVEFHKSAEVNIAVTDFMLTLGHCWDISEDMTYSVEQPEVFFVEKGTVYEMFGTTLHLSPLRVTDEGFRDVIILPRGTNTPLSEEENAKRDQAVENGDAEAKLLLLKQKWVISHPEREPLIKQGAHAGLTGPNKELYY